MLVSTYILVNIYMLVRLNVSNRNIYFLKKYRININVHNACYMIMIDIYLPILSINFLFSLLLFLHTMLLSIYSILIIY